MVIAGAEGKIIEGRFHGEWVDERDSWLSFRKDCDYRVKDDLTYVNGYRIPKPTTQQPTDGTYYYVPTPDKQQLFRKDVWEGFKTDLQAFKRGLIHLTPEAAIAHAKAMLGIDPDKDGE